MEKEKLTPEEAEKLVYEIYKKTLGYELEKIVINEDGTNTHLHSDRFLDEHPERRDSPEFTEEEERGQAAFLMHMVEECYDGHSLFEGFKNKPVEIRKK